MLIPGPDGQFIPNGRVRRTLEASFLDGTVPGWLTIPAASGIAAIQPITAGVGALTITSAAANGAVAQLNGPAFSLKDFPAIFWTLEGLSWDTASAVITPEIGITGVISGATGGASVFQRTTDTTSVFRTYRPGPGQDDTTIANQLRQTARRNLTLALFTRSKEVALMADDQVIAWAPKTNLWAANSGTVTPYVKLTTAEAVAHSFSVRQVRFALEHN